MRRIDGAGRTAEVPEDPLNERRLLDAGDDAQLAAALPAGVEVDGEHALEALRPGEAPLAVGGRCRPVRAGRVGSGSKIRCVVPSRYGVFSVSRTCPLPVSASRSVATGGLAT